MFTRPRRSLRLEPLEPRLMLSTTVTESESNNTRAEADEFSLSDDGTVLVGTSQNKNDRDFFQVTPTEDVTAKVQLNGLDRPVSLKVTDAQGNVVFTTSPGQATKDFVELEAGVTYYFRVRSETDSAANYNVLVDPQAGGGGGRNSFRESEDNNVKARADAFDLGNDGLIHLLGTSEGSDDADYFVFTPAKSGTLRINVEAMSDIFAQFAIEDEDGNTLFETNPDSGVNSGKVKLQADGTIYIRLLAPSDASADYDVKLSLQ